MNTRVIVVFGIALSLVACQRDRAAAPATPAANAVSAVVVVSGDKQEAGVGSLLEQPVVIQVNDAQGNVLANVRIRFSSTPRADFEPQAGTTDANGQLSTMVHLGVMAGPSVLEASASQGAAIHKVTIAETVLDYRQFSGKALAQKYCSRCHNPESSPLQVSNFDNLDPKPHEFGDGQTLNLMSDSDLTAIIAHGGPALGKPAQMPAYGATLKPAEISSIVAYIRAIASPPYQPPGVGYENH